MYRIFRVFPNGESSLSNFSQLLFGDYRGWIESQQLKLELFSWPKKAQGNAFCFGYRVRLEFVHHGLRPAMDVNVSVVRVVMAGVMDVTSTTVAQRCSAFPDKGQETMLNMRIMYLPSIAR